MADGLLTVWGDSMSAVENVKGFGNVVARIKNQIEFYSSIAELEVAGRAGSPANSVDGF